MRGLMVVMMFVAVAASAQVPDGAAPQPVKLSAASNVILTRLAGLDELPAAEWRVHAGDLPHGEAVDLDDSRWARVTEPYKGETEAMWFRRTIVVPDRLDGYDLTGAKIRFAFDIWAEGPVPVIVYFDGRRVAMGEAMEPISLFEHAKPGDRMVVAVKALDTVDAKHFAGAHFKIDYAAGRPSPNTVRLEAVAATNLLPALLQNQAELKKDAQVVEDALAAVDLSALSGGRQQEFDRSLEAAQRKLEVLRPVMAQASFHLTGDAHIDAAWVWPWTETVDVVKRTFGTALQLMREYPSYTFSQSAAAYYAWMAEKYPWMNQDIQARAKEGRWEVVGGMWVEPDLNLPDGESIVRQLLLGTRFFKQQYGADVHVGWNPDSFGYTWQLPQIYKKSGIDYFVTQKMDWNDTNRLPLKLFYWQSPDGSRVLTYFPHNYTNYVEPDRLAEDFNVARRENPGLPKMMHLYGIGDHGGGPTRSMLDEAQSWMQKDKVFPAEHYGTAEAYFHEMEPLLDRADMPVWNYAAMAAGKGTLPEPPKGKISAPVWNDELYLEYTRGVYTSQAQEKRNLRESEERLLDAEKWAAMDWLRGAAYPATELNEAWKKALFNQFHDIAAGSSTGVVYVDAQRDYDAVRLATQAVQANTQADLASAVDTSRAARLGAVPVLVWNSLGWKRTDVVGVQVQLAEDATAIEIVDEDGKVLPSQVEPGAGPRRTVTFIAKDVPSMGYRVFYARAAKDGPLSGVKASEHGGSITLENAALRLTIDAKTGCITHLVSLASGFDSIAAGGCGNELQAFVDKPKDYDAWNIDPGTFDHYSVVAADTVTLDEATPLRASVRIKRTLGASTIIQQILLDAGLDRVEVHNAIDWQEQHVLLKAAFPLAASGPDATYEIPYGTIARPTTRRNSWESAKFEVPALRWADLGDAQHGFSLLNEAKYGYDAKDNVLRLTLLRSPTAPDPKADRGMQRFAYALYPHALDWSQAQTMLRGYEFNYGLTAQQVQTHAGVLPATHSFVSAEPDNLVLTAVKKTEDGDGLLLRFFEWAGKDGVARIALPHGVVSARLANLMELPEGAALDVHGDAVEVPYSHYGITTVLVRFAGTPDFTLNHRLSD